MPSVASEEEVSRHDYATQPSTDANYGSCIWGVGLLRGLANT